MRLPNLRLASSANWNADREGRAPSPRRREPILPAVPLAEVHNALAIGDQRTEASSIAVAISSRSAGSRWARLCSW
jgi:hypothetical protein